MLFGTQGINQAGHLEVGGVDALQLAERFGTPLYVMDEQGIRERCREYLRAFRKWGNPPSVVYASKAFWCRAMAALVAEEGLRVDAASSGELEVALAGGVPADSITFHGNYKKEEELSEALEAGVGVVAVDSVDELRSLSRLASEARRGQQTILRVAPGIDAHTLDAISTGRNDTKFGITIENGAALAAVREALGLPGIELIGLHAHIGSQIQSLAPYELLVEKLMDFCQVLFRETGFLPPLLSFGGGLAIRYLEEDTAPPIADLAEVLGQSIHGAAADRGLKVPQVSVEPGRSIVGDLGLTLYTLGPIKTVPAAEGGTRTYATVDGGLSDNPRPLMYGARYQALVAARASEKPDTTVRIVGRHCETDALFDAALPAPRSGDVLAVLCTGAYNHVMASNYNFFCRPPVVFVSHGHARLVVRRETNEDLLRRDVV